MKKLMLPLVLMSASLLATADDNASLSGKWQVHNSIEGNESDQRCTFTQKDDQFTGTCSSDNGNVNVTGKINGKKVTWSYKSEYNGSPLTVNYEGTIDSANKITGSVSVPEYSADGDFSAIPSK